MFIGVLFITASQVEMTQMSTNWEWLSKLVHLHNEILLRSKKGTDCQHIHPNDESQMDFVR